MAMSEVQLSVIILGVLLAGAVSDYLSDDGDDESPHWSADAARAAYVDGEIGIDELERRLDRTLDDRFREIRDRVEGVTHVGPHRAARIAVRLRRPYFRIHLAGLGEIFRGKRNRI